MTMSLNEYQKATRTTAKYPGAHKGDWDALSYLGLGLGEAGEVQGKLKKISRDDNKVATDEVKEAIAGELGDVLWYVARLADELGFDLDFVAAKNVEKLQSRMARGVLGGSGDYR